MSETRLVQQIKHNEFVIQLPCEMVYPFLDMVMLYTRLFQKKLFLTSHRSFPF